MRDHGGNLDEARAAFGGAPEAWIDLSTGINRVPYPLPALPPRAWSALPESGATEALIAAARAAYGTPAAILPLAGAQAAIQMIPHLHPANRARVLGPTYNEHAACLRAAGWEVEEVTSPRALEGAALAVVVNPNNPDGRRLAPADLLALAGKVGRLVVDESFADPQPGLSVASEAGRDGMIVLRSFGKFYGLAGLRLGFALGAEEDIAALRAMSGPWPVSGPALEIGRIALSDRAWQRATTERLQQEVSRLDALTGAAGWEVTGGTELFRLYRTPGAVAARRQLAEAHIWSRIFPWSPDIMRLGFPGSEEEWSRLGAALA